MSTRKLIWLATACGLAVTVLTFLSVPGLLPALAEATRTTAQLSGVFFALALMARGGFPQSLAENRLSLMMAFVAAHGVHLAAVAARAAVEPGNSLRSFTLNSVLTVGLGLGLLSLAAFTARATSGARRRLNIFSFYTLWTTFTLGFFTYGRGTATKPADPSAAIMFLVMLLAMAWRVVAVFLRPLPMARAASARG